MSRLPESQALLTGHGYAPTGNVTPSNIVKRPRRTGQRVSYEEPPDFAPDVGRFTNTAEERKAKKIAAQKAKREARELAEAGTRAVFLRAHKNDPHTVLAGRLPVDESAPILDWTNADRRSVSSGRGPSPLPVFGTVPALVRHPSTGDVSGAPSEPAPAPEGTDEKTGDSAPVAPAAAFSVPQSTAHFAT